MTVNEDIPTFKQKYWNKRTQRLLAFLLLAITFIVAVSIMKSAVSDARDAADRAEAKASFVEEAAKRDAEAQKVKDHNDCVSSNKAREGIRKAFTALLDQAKAAQIPDVPRTPEEQAAFDAQFDAFVQQFLESNLNQNLPIVDCDKEFPVSSS